jgi:hypothetical protein
VQIEARWETEQRSGRPGSHRTRDDSGDILIKRLAKEHLRELKQLHKKFSAAMEQIQKRYQVA